MKTRTVSILIASVVFLGALIVSYTALHVAQYNSGPWEAGAAPVYGEPFVGR